MAQEYEPINFEKLFGSCPDLYLILNPDLKIIAVTEAYLLATMTKKDDIVGKHVFEVFPDNPNDKEAEGVSNVRASLEYVLENKTANTMAVQKFDIRNPEKDEFEVRYWSPKNIPVLGAGHELLYIIHKVEDVTEFVRLKENENKQQLIHTTLMNQSERMENEIMARAQEIQEANNHLLTLNKELTEKTIELKRSNDELDQFASIAAHDIQAPFRTVGMSLDLIEEEVGKTLSPEGLSAFDRIKVARERIKTLIQNLLDFARVTQHPEPFQSVNTHDVVSDILKLLGETKSNITIDCPLPIIRADYSQMFQLFQNLINNAIKFQDKSDPIIHISGIELTDTYQFSIKDNGIGIEPKYFNKIFQVFQRLHNQSQFPGTGLGLSICKKIVERHGGKIWVESELKKGTTFSFIIPKINI
jgi:signal transduction histidine kinase